MHDLLEFRRQKDLHFRSPHSPLPIAERQNFPGLKYFEPDPGYALEAHFSHDPDQSPTMMATSNGLNKHYTRHGWLGFQLQGRALKLAAYLPQNSEPDDKPLLFVPFTDATNGTQSYIAGRYLELELQDPTTPVLMDFNRAYTPYCAYGSGWSCPIPPKENRLEVPICAGEQHNHD